MKHYFGQHDAQYGCEEMLNTQSNFVTNMEKIPSIILRGHATEVLSQREYTEYTTCPGSVNSRGTTNFTFTDDLLSVADGSKPILLFFTRVNK